MKLTIPSVAFAGLLVFFSTFFPGVTAADSVSAEQHQHPPDKAHHEIVNPHGKPGQSLVDTLANQPPEPIGLYPREDWPLPMDDRMRHFFFLADVLEVQPDGDDSEARWDIESYYGGDFNRIWFKSEGEKSVTDGDDYHLDAQVLYGRFFAKYYDFQIGLRGETTDFIGRNRTRAHAVIGIEGVVPYQFAIEPLLFISHEGDISARFTATRDLLLTQRLILQGRVETAVAIQDAEEFGVASGINNVELGVRLRYEIRREFAPYVGISWSRSVAETEDLVRSRGEDPSQLRFVAGVRLWY